MSKKAFCWSMEYLWNLYLGVVEVGVVVDLEVVDEEEDVAELVMEYQNNQDFLFYLQRLFLINNNQSWDNS